RPRANGVPESGRLPRCGGRSRAVAGPGTAGQVARGRARGTGSRSGVRLHVDEWGTAPIRVLAHAAARGEPRRLSPRPGYDAAAPARRRAAEKPGHDRVLPRAPVTQKQTTKARRI